MKKRAAGLITMLVCLVLLSAAVNKFPDTTSLYDWTNLVLLGAVCGFLIGFLLFLESIE